MSNIWIGLAGAGILFASGLISPPRQNDSPAGPASLNPALAAVVFVLAAVIVRLSQLSVLGRTGYFAADFDECTRWAITRDWCSSPYFFTFWDGIWLTGGFAYSGFFMKLTHDPIRGMQVANLLAQIFTLGSIAAAAWMLGGRPWCGAAAAALASIGYPFIFIGTGCMPEGLLGGAACFAFAALMGYLRPGASARARLACAGAAGVGLFVMASLHYNGWMAILVAAPLLAAGAWARRRELGPAGWIGLGVIAVGAAAFPAAWIFESARVLGAPFKFFENQNRVNDIQMIDFRKTFGDHNPLWVYPRLFWRQAGPLLPLLLAAGLPGSGAARGLRPARVSAALLVFLFLALTSVRAQMTGFCPPFDRYLIIPYALSLAVAGAALGTLPSPAALFRDPARPASVRRLAVAGFAAGAGLFAVGWAELNFKMTGDPESHLNAKAWDHDARALAEWLRGELRHPQQLSENESQAPIAFHAPGDLDTLYVNLITYYGDRRGQARLLTPEQWPAVPPEFPLVITPRDDTPEGFARVANFGRWRVLRRPGLQGN